MNKNTKKTNKRNIIFILIALILVLGVAYAAFSDTLTISGTANAKGSFDVEFTAASLDADDSTGIDKENSTAAISADKNTVTLTAKDFENGQSMAVFNITVHNASTTTARLNGLTVTYNGNDTSDDIFEVANDLAVGSTIAVDGTASFTVTVKFKDGKGVEDLTSENLTADFNISLQYTQA